MFSFLRLPYTLSGFLLLFPACVFACISCPCFSLLCSAIISQIASVKVGTYTRVDTGARQVGVSAQSLEGVLPDAVYTSATGMKSVAYGNAALAMCVAMAQKIQELEAKLDALTK